MSSLLFKIINHLGVKSKEIEKIELIKDHIIHFKHIKVSNLSEEEIKSLEEKISKVKNYVPIDKKLIAAKFANNEITEQEFENQISSKSIELFKQIKINRIAQHYFLPIIYSELEKIDYIKHIINIPSEVSFIKNLEKHIESTPFDFDWMFSKINESFDKISIPYFNNNLNSFKEFFPDFIFWLKKGNTYKIVFVDPKGTKQADYQIKVDGFIDLFFDENKKSKEFKYKDFTITFDLKLYNENIANVGREYSNFWINNNDFSFLKI
jgi:hypothetical protein